MRRDERLHHPLVADVAEDEVETGYATVLIETVHTVNETVDHGDGMFRAEELAGENRSDVARAAGDENAHWPSV